MDSLRWWERETPDEWINFEQRILKFEDSVFLAFPNEPPDKKMLLINKKDWRNGEWIPSKYPNHFNNDQEYLMELYGWRSWPCLIGYRTQLAGDLFKILSSVEALIYYAPAFMLHWLYFRNENMVAIEEIEELFIPPNDNMVTHEFSGYGFKENNNYGGFYIKRFYEFRDGMTVEQRKVCREFCTLFIPWNYRNVDFSLVEEAYLRLLSYWE